MPRYMYDSVTSADIPAGALMVAGYVDGRYAWTAADWARHPRARQVRITVGSGTLDADVADIENGDYNPVQAAAWAKRKLAAHQYPVLYFSLGNWPAVQAALIAAVGNTGLVGAWVANWNRLPNLEPGWLAHQYVDPPASGGHFDLSIVADYWPGVDPPPAPAPTPAPTPTPTPPPAPPPTSGLPVNEARAAFATLAGALTSGLQALLGEIDQATQKLKDS